MSKIGFSAEKYIEEQSQHILERINAEECERLYLEFGGKLVHDKHAMRVLPGFDENAKIKLLQKMKDQAEIIICIYAGDITTNKTRQDFGITYDLEVLRLIDTFRRYELAINSVVVTRYEEQPTVDMFINKLNRRGIKTYKHKFTKGYPTDVDVIVSDEGYGANPYIEVTKPLVVVTGPGGGSGKLATCLSQLYHDNRRGKKVRYAKFETFPVWNLPLKHPVNAAHGNGIALPVVPAGEVFRDTVTKTAQQFSEQPVQFKAVTTQPFHHDLFKERVRAKRGLLL